MSASVILVIGNPVSQASSGNGSSDQASGLFSPLVCQEILGQSVLERTLELFKPAGIYEITVLVDGCLIEPVSRVARRYPAVAVIEDSVDRWPVRGKKRRNAPQSALVMRLGAYAEFAPAEILDFHRKSGNAVTRVAQDGRALDIWALTMESRQDLSLSSLMESHDSASCEVRGYVRLLAHLADLRSLAVDMLCGRCEGRPMGRQIRPGVWVAKTARIHSQARLVAPAYVGRKTTVESHAVIARFSNVESDCRVGPGTHISSSTIFSHTQIGRGLFVSDSIVEGTALMHTRKGALLEVADAKLLAGTMPAQVARRPSEAELEVQSTQVIQIKPQPRAIAAESCSLGLVEDEG